MKKLDYKKMVKQIDALVETDFMFDMDCKTLLNSSPFTQKEAMQMVKLLGKIYQIAHCVHCTACQGKFALPSK